MTLMTLRATSGLALAVCLLAVPVAQAQTLPHGDTGGGATSAEPRKGAGRARGAGVRVSPYIEAAQLVSAELSPGDDVLTYSRIAAGVDVSATGRQTAASASVRVEHYFGWNKGAQDGTVVSGLARGYATITPGLQFEAGGLATRSRIDGSGSAVQGATGSDPTGGGISSGFAGAAVDLRPDLDQVPALAAERDAQWARVAAAEFLTAAEKRALLGLPPLPAAEGA